MFEVSFFNKNYFYFLSDPFNGNIDTATIPALIYLLFQHFKTSELNLGFFH